MAGNANRVALGYGRAYIAAYSSSSPEALPSDSTARDGSWGANWVELGYTGGVQTSLSQEYRHVEVDQSTIEIKSFVTKQDASIELTLKETSVENLKYALGFGTLATSGSSGVITWTTNPTITEYTLGIEGPSPSGTVTEAQRIYFYRVVPISEPEIVFSREEETVCAVKFKPLQHSTGSIGFARQYRTS